MISVDGVAWLFGRGVRSKLSRHVLGLCVLGVHLQVPDFSVFVALSTVTASEGFAESSKEMGRNALVGGSRSNTIRIFAGDFIEVVDPWWHVKPVLVLDGS